MATTPPARGQPAPTNSAREVATAPSEKPKLETEVDRHRKRVSGLQETAKELETLCAELGAKDGPATAKKTLLTPVVRRIDDKITVLTSNVTPLARQRAELERKINGEKDPEVKKALDREMAIVTRQLEAAKKALVALPFTTPDTISADKVEPDEKALGTRLDEAIRRYHAAPPDPAAVPTPKPLDICQELCPTKKDASPHANQPLDFCALADPVLANAAVLADWPSVDALIEYVGTPRRKLEVALATYQIEATALPKDRFPGPREERKNKAARPIEDVAKDENKPAPPQPPPPPPNGDKNDPCLFVLDPGALRKHADDRETQPKVLALAPAVGAAAAAATGLGGLDLSLASAQTAELALASLAKVIEDRAKRESLVWFLEQLHEHVCGSEKDACESQVKGAREATTAVEARRKDLVEACHRRDVAAKAATSAPEAEKAAKVEATASAEKQKTKEFDVYKAALETEANAAAQEDECVAKQNGVALIEIRTFWLPTTCALARDRTDYIQYGGGASLLRTLQGAIATDVRSWPGVAAGLGIGAGFWLDVQDARGTDQIQQQLPRMFECDPDAKGSDAARCKATRGLRDATARLVLQLQSGADASASLYRYAADIDALNIPAAPVQGAKLHSDHFQLAACAMSLPRVFHAYGDHVRATGLDKKEEVEALILAGLAGAPACWTAVGKGWDRETCPGLGAKPGSGSRVCEDKVLAPCDDKDKDKDGTCPNKPSPAWKRKADLERLTTLLLWYRATSVPADKVVAQWGTLRTAWETYLAAFEAYKKNGASSIAPPPFDVSVANNAKTFDEVIKAFSTYATDAARAAQKTDLTKLLQASVALARASIDFGVVLTDGLGKSLDPKLYPGINDKITGDQVKAQAALAATSKELARLSGHLATAEMALTQDWGAAVARVVAIVRADVADRCKKEDVRCARLMERLSRYSGLFSALISEKDPEKVAEALDAAAMPIGGWRTKQIPGATTISLTAFPGFGVGFIERRWGQYGTVREYGENNYLAAPTLQMPFGVDFAWGWQSAPMSTGLFVSLLDPAAYLHWDPDNGGRLPAAQLLTALSPGVAFRASLGPSPFVATVYGVFRPNFRAWEPDISAPAAHALQVGVSVGVDVTLFELYSKRNQLRSLP